MAIAIVGQSITNLAPAATSHTFAFTVPAGTDTLVVLMTMRTATGGLAATISSITYNGDAVTAGFNNFAAGTFDINTLIAYRRSPDIGTFNVVINCANVAGGTAWCLALSGVISSGNPVGGTNAQRTSSSTATSVGLGLTPASGSLLLTVMASGNNPGTVTAFSGASFVDAGTGRYSPNGDMPATHRYRLDAAAASTPVSATFSDASNNCGGLLAEILADVPASATTDVSGNVDVVVAITGSTGAAAGAEISNATFRQLSAWTEIMSLQPDAAGVDRRIISAGVVGTPTYTLDQRATDRNYSWNFRLSDGNVRIESAPSTQTLTPHHLALIHNGALGQVIVLNGEMTGQVKEGEGLSGELIIATGGERIGAHGAASPGPYTGIVGRYLLYENALTYEQVRLLALSETDPSALWGVGSEDDAQASNQSVVACPLHTELDGQASATLQPVILDPSGGLLSIASVTQPADGTLEISDLELIYRPDAGWQGTDSATYTASDTFKFSTGKLTFRQTRPPLNLTNDAISVATSGTVTFDPRVNDTGAGVLRTIAVTQGAVGTVTLLADGRVRYDHGGSMSTDTFSVTIADDYDQKTSQVTITITGGNFLTASDVSVNTTQGTAIDIDVVAAVSASANLLPVVVAPGSITTPAPSGTAALQANGMIRYTPATGVSGIAATFGYTIKPSALATPTDTATATVQVSAVGDLPKLQPAVAFSRWHCVGFDTSGRKASYPSGRAGFAAAVASSTLVAGDVIVLADGTYSGAMIDTLAKSGTASADGHNHIMVRARNHGGAIIDCQLQVHGAYWWFTGIRFTHTDSGNPNYQSSIQAILADQAGLWITNCMFTGHAFLHLYPRDNATNLRICYNTVAPTTPGSATDTGVFITMWPYQQGDRAPPDTEIAWNRVTLATKATNNETSRPLIILHSSHSGAADQTQFVTQSFRFHHNHCAGAWAEAFYIKRNVCIEFNYVEWTNTATARHMVTMRHGLLTNNLRYDIGGIVRGNRFRSAERVVILMSGSGPTVTNNVFEGGGHGEIWLSAGNGVNFDASPPRDGCDNAQIVENTGFSTVVVGGEPGASNVGANNASGRNGWPDNVRLYRGTSDWSPTITRPSDGGNQAPAPAINPGGNVYGTGNAAKVTPIQASDLAGAGCDPM